MGRYPRYAEAASELVRFWHQKRYSKKLEPEIEKFLKRVQEDATKYQETIPDPDKHLNEEEVITIAQECFRLYHEYIWPEVKKLVEMDLHTEEQRQMSNEFRKKQKELEQKRKELEDAKASGDQERQEELQKEIEGLKKELDPFNQLPENVKKELQKEIDKAIQDSVEELNKQIEEKEKQAQEAKQKQEQLEKEIQELKEKLEQAKKSGNQKLQEELEKELQKKRGEKLEQELKQKQAEKDWKDIQDSLEKMQQESEGIPYPEDKLSEKTKQELEKLFQKLPKSKKQELKDKAQKQLEGFEDAVNKKLEGKLNEDKPETHQERREKENKEREAARKSREAKVGRERIEKELERIRKERMTPYEQARAEVVGLIDNLYFRLRRIFRPEEYGEEEAGYPVGQRLDISRAMQAEKDVEQKRKLWIRETAPAKKDCRFWHMVDLSNSMADKKIKETFKGFIIAGEAIDRLENLNSATTTVHQGITGFHNRIFPIKKINQRFTKEVEDGLSTMPERTLDADSGTNTYSATLVALENLKQHRGETGNFLLTFSDGEPNRDIRNNLKELLRKGKEERERLKIKVGLIWLGEFKDEEKLKELVKEYGYDFGLVMQAIKPSLEEKAAGKKDFSEALADLLEDFIEHPEKY